MKLDQVDRSILDILQNAMPLNCRPFKDMADQLGIEENEVIDRIAAMKESGLIRRIGGIMNSRQLGYTSTLCAMTVPPDRIDEVAAVINELAGVTHNYVRDHHYNIWFTLTASSQAEIEKQLQGLEQTSGLPVMRMPAKKLYKIKVSFAMEDKP